MNRLILISLLVGLALASTAQASKTYNFYCITWNNPSAGLVGEAAFSVNVSDYGSGQVLFTFGVTPPASDPFSGSYYIDGVYFYDNENIFAGPASPPDDGLFDYDYDDLLYPGVDFEPNATPDHLPGFDPGDYGVSKHYHADADPPPTINGVGPGELLGVLLYGTYADVIDGMDSGAAIVGIKGQGFGRWSESFTTIPAPGAILLGSIGVCLVGWLRRRRTL